MARFRTRWNELGGSALDPVPGAGRPRPQIEAVHPTKHPADGTVATQDTTTPTILRPTIDRHRIPGVGWSVL